MTEPLADLAAFAIYVAGRTVKLVAMKIVVDQMCANSLEYVARWEGCDVREHQRLRASAQVWIDKSWTEKLCAVPPLMIALKY